MKALGFQMCKQNQESQLNTIKSEMWFSIPASHKNILKQHTRWRPSITHLQEKKPDEEKIKGAACCWQILPRLQ